MPSVSPFCDVCGKVGIDHPFGGPPRHESPLGYQRPEDYSSRFNLGQDTTKKTPNEAAEIILER